MLVRLRQGTGRPRHGAAAGALAALVTLATTCFLIAADGELEAVSARMLFSCEEEVVIAGGAPALFSADGGSTRHFRVEVPAGLLGSQVQVRVELLQPGRATFGAHLLASDGLIDCSRTAASDFQFEADRPSNCVSGACQELEWVIVPGVEGSVHVAVQGASDDFWLYAEATAFTLTDMQQIAEADEIELAQLEGSVAEGFAAWYRLSNSLQTPSGGLGKHIFRIQNGAPGMASRLSVTKVPPAKAGQGWAEKAAGAADATAWSAAVWGWGQADVFSAPEGPFLAAEYALGVETHLSSLNATKFGKFSPCTLSGLVLQVARACDRATAQPFKLQAEAMAAGVYTKVVAPAWDVFLGGEVSPAVHEGTADRGDWQFFSFQAAPQVSASSDFSAWGGSGMSLVRISLSLIPEPAAPPQFPKTPRGSMRASVFGGFPLEQLGVTQYQEAQECRPNCTLVVALTPGASEVSVGIVVNKEDQDNRKYTIDATLLDLQCGWLPSCSDCASAAASGIDCVWTEDAFAAGGGFCHSAAGFPVDTNTTECPASEAANTCNVPASVTGDPKDVCTECPPGCGWCGQPFGGNQHAGACVPLDLSDGTRWVGGTGPLAGVSHLMAVGYCSAWDERETARDSLACDQLAAEASAGACGLASGDCEACGGLGPVCAFCTDPADPSSGVCTPLGSDISSCVASSVPWVGFGPGDAACPPGFGEPHSALSGSVPELPQASAQAATVAVQQPLPLPAGLGPLSLGFVPGVSSAAKYLAVEMSPGTAGFVAYNSVVHLRANGGASLRAMAALDALPVASAALSEATHAWDSDGAEVLLPVGSLVSGPLPSSLFLSVEQEAQATPLGAQSVEAWIESSPGILVPSESDSDSTTAQAYVCCGGSALFSLELQASQSLGGYVTVWLEAVGAAAPEVLLLSGWNGFPTRDAFSYKALEAGSSQKLTIFLGTPGDEERLSRQWFVAVAAPAEGTDVGETSAVVYLRAERTLPGATLQSVSTSDSLYPIWMWVVIAVCLGLGLGLVLLVVAYLNKLAYKSLRRKMYAMDDTTGLGDMRSGSFNSPSGAKPGQGWTSGGSPTSSANPRGSARSPMNLLRFLGTPTKDPESGGLLGGKKSKKWYDPKTFRQEDGNEAPPGAVADSSKTHVTPLLADDGPGQEDVEMVVMGALPLSDRKADDPSTRLIVEEPSDRAPPESLIESVNAQLWRNSAAPSSSDARDMETPLTPTSPASATAAGSSCGGMHLLNERMSVLARAEELEEQRKPRPDSANPVRLRGQASLREDGGGPVSLRDKFSSGGGTAGGPGGSAQVPPSFNILMEHAVSNYGAAPSVSVESSPRRGLVPVSEGSSTRPSLAQSPTAASPPALSAPESPKPSPTNRKRAPPPLSVTTESTEPTGSDIVMLSEDQAQRLTADQSRENLRASFWTVDDGRRPSGSSMFQNENEGDDVETWNRGEVEPFDAEELNGRPLPGATVATLSPTDGHTADDDLAVDDILEL